LTTHSVSVSKLPVDAEKLGFFRFGNVNEGVILTNEFGEWHFMGGSEFRRLLAGTLDAEDPNYAALGAKGFLRESLDLEAFSDAMRRRKRFVGVGPQLHVLRLSDAHGKLSVEVTKEIVDHAMLSTSSSITFRLVQGHEPLDLDLLQFFAQYAVEKNRYEGKAITHEVVTDCRTIDEDAAKWLVDKRFRVRSVVASDGQLDDAQKKAFQLLADAASARRRGETPFVADVHIGADNPGGAAIYAALAESGVPRCRLHPVLEGDGAIDHIGLMETYGAFLDAQLRAAKEGSRILEERTAGMLHKALRTDAVDDPALRSPSGAGVMAYDTAGRLFPSLRAADLHAEGDEMFLLGTAGITSYKEAVTHPTRRALVLASTLETLPMSSDHWSCPFWGIDPVDVYARSGDLFPKMPTAPQARSSAAMAHALFHRLVGADDAGIETFRGLLA
jgi:hypothetical protein